MYFLAILILCFIVQCTMLVPTSSILRNIESGLEPPTKKETGARDLGGKSAEKPGTKAVKKTVVDSVPRFGFEQDHVISEKTDSAVRKEEDRRRSPDISEDVTENIEAG